MNTWLWLFTHHIYMYLCCSVTSSCSLSCEPFVHITQHSRSFVCKPGPWLSIMWTRAQGPALISLWGLLSRTVVKYSHVKWPNVVLWYKDNLSVCCTKIGPPLPTVNLFFPYLWAYFFITWYDLLVNNLILQIEQSGRIYREWLYRNLWHIFFF